jgi:3-isopropylmalate/(R)-2-methylmalate dehydratase small subunit
VATPFGTLRGPAAPLLLPDIDTDVLAPSHGGRGNPGASAFGPLRYRPDGSDDPSFVLNDDRFRGAPILLAGRNFGCGSSREAAVWGLVALGVRCVVAVSFGDIFAANCVQNGLLPIALDDQLVRSLGVAAAGGEPFEIDLGAAVITTPLGDRIPFAIDPRWQQQLLEGLDDLTSTLRRLDDVTAFRATDHRRRPWIYHLDPSA